MQTVKASYLKLGGNLIFSLYLPLGDHDLDNHDKDNHNKEDTDQTNQNYYQYQFILAFLMLYFLHFDRLSGLPLCRIVCSSSLIQIIF